MVVIVLMLVSFTLISVIIVAVLVSAQKESARSRSVAERGVKDLLPAFNFIGLEPLDPSIDARHYMKTLSRVLVSDYLQFPDIRQVVDDGLPRRGYRRDSRPLDPGPRPS
jgi:hypothetical protein